MREIRSYVVRIYRREGREVSGVVEDVQTGCIHSFHTAQDLWTALALVAPAVPAKESSK